MYTRYLKLGFNFVKGDFENFSLWINMAKSISSLCFIIPFLIFSSCKKFIEVEAPSTSINAENVYLNDATATSVLTGIYAKMASGSAFKNTSPSSICLFGDLSADNLVPFLATDANAVSYYKNQVLTSSTGTQYWNIYYPLIVTCNSAIEGIGESNSLSPAVKQQLMGEAKFLRAFFYFYLVNLYGDVPLILGTDYLTNASFPRTSAMEVYAQIRKDLLESITLLRTDYVGLNLASTTAERIRPNRYAALALLSRVSLFMKDYEGAEYYSTQIINNTGDYGILPLDQVFLKNSKEAIWQLQPVDLNSPTPEGLLFHLASTGGPSSTKPYYLSNFLINSFESADKRLTSWVSSIVMNNVRYYYPNKYKVGIVNQTLTEYSMVLRMAEQYLIRAEARVYRNNLSGAISDTNVIRIRAGLSGTTAATQSTILDAIFHERQGEFFTEYGHRWLDLKRSGRAESVMPVVCTTKGGVWSNNWLYYPIPLIDLTRNPNLNQNNGY